MSSPDISQHDKEQCWNCHKMFPEEEMTLDPDASSNKQLVCKPCKEFILDQRNEPKYRFDPRNYGGYFSNEMPDQKDVEQTSQCDSFYSLSHYA